MNVGWVEIVNIIIIFQLLVFSAFLLFRKKHFLSNYILGAFLISQSIGLFSGLIDIQKNFFYSNNPHVFFIGYPFVFLWSPTFYFYIKSIVFKNYRLKSIQILHLIPFLICLLFFSVTYYFFSAETKKIILNDSSYFYFSHHELIDVILRIQVLFYVILSVKILYSIRKKLKENYSSISKTNISWLNFIIIGYIVCYLISVAFVYTEFYLKDFDRILYLGNTLQFFIYFNIIFFKAWEQPEIFKDIEEGTKYKNSKLTKEEAKEWIDRLNDFVLVKKPYLDPELTLNQFAEKLVIPSRILSQILNEYFGQNFFDYINRLRIEDAKRVLCDTSSNKNVLEILYESGFNSKATFNRVFKKETGLSPTEYKKKFAETGISIK